MGLGRATMDLLVSSVKAGLDMYAPPVRGSVAVGSDSNSKEGENVIA